LILWLILWLTHPVVDPVVDANGHSFERSAIERSLEIRPGNSPTKNPKP
jgi:hypothetical protein